MNQAQFSVAVVADDKTAKGVASSKKNIASIPKHVSSVNKAEARALQDTTVRSSRGIIRTLGSVEQATARVFGGRSVTSGFATRLGAVREAAAATGEGLGAAATEGSAFASVLGVVGVAAGATIGVLAAAGYAAFKLADGWAKGAASIGRTAETIGVATKALQEFAAAGERVGVDKGTSTGAIGSLSQSLNDARYGRNRNALGGLAKLGIQLKLGPDGNVDIGAMLPDIANAIARQNPSGRRTAAQLLGIPLSALPIFAQGGQALSADMASAENDAYIATPGDIGRAKRIQRKGAIVDQMKDKVVALGGSATADLAETGYDGAIAAGRGALSGATSFGGVVRNTFAPAAAMVERGGAAIERAATAIGDGIIGRADASVPSLAGRTFKATPSTLSAIRRGARATGIDYNTMLSIAAQESTLNPTAHAGIGSASGLYQFTDQTWLGAIKQHGGQFGLGHVAESITGRPGKYRIADPALASRVLGFRNDPYFATLFAGTLMREAAPGVARAAGHGQATAGDLYMNHFLGPTAAQRFFRLERANPAAPAAPAFGAEARSNRAIFYDESGAPRSLEQVLLRIEQLAQRPVNVIVTGPSGIKARVEHPGGALQISHAPVGHH